MIINTLKKLIKPRYNTLNRIEINKRLILHNLAVIQGEQKDCSIFPVLKANAYGHGLKEICSILNESKVQMVAVDSFPEAQIVYRYFKGKALIIGEMPLDAYHYINWQRTELCVYNKLSLENIASITRNAKIHLFLNTGMNREGIVDLSKFIDDNKKALSKVEVTGICSHLAMAEGDGKMNSNQLDSFLKDLDIAEKVFHKLQYVHLANSAGSFALHHQRLNACRPGLAIYGYNPFEQHSPHYKRASALKPALELFSSVVSIQRVLKGESISYNREYIAPKDMQSVVIPFGYYEGLDRRLANIAQFKFRGKYVQLVGNVCMNMSCLAVGANEKIEVGEELQIISSNDKDINSVINLARLEKTISYEILVKLQANIRRIIVDK